MSVKNWVTRKLLQNGTLSPTFAGGVTIEEFAGGAWINMPVSGPSGIGIGGAGSSPWVAYCSNDGDWFQSALPGDIAILNEHGRLLIGYTADGAPALTLDGLQTQIQQLNVTNSATLTGTTAGTITSSMPEQGVAKKFVAYANGYENNTTTAQTITFPTAFSNPPIITSNTTGLSLSVSATGLTINAPDNTTAYSGVIIVEGI